MRKWSWFSLNMGLLLKQVKSLAASFRWLSDWAKSSLVAEISARKLARTAGETGVVLYHPSERTKLPGSA